MPPDLVAMRMAATVVHCIPGVRLRLRVGDLPPLDVGRLPEDDDDTVPACVFREAVVRAHQAQLESDQEPSCIPAIDVGVPPGGCVHPNGIVRVAFDRVEVHAFATTLTPVECCRLFAGRTDTDHVVHLHHDCGTGVTLVHVEAAPRERAEVFDLMDDLLVGCVTEELIGV